MNWVFQILFLISFNINAHDFHLSKSLIKYSDESKSIQVSMHIFIDDLEKALEAYSEESLQICTENENPESESLIDHYLTDKFEIIQNGEKLEHVFVGKEISDDLAAVWCYFEFENIESRDKLEITNNVLMEVFNDQKNMIEISLSGEKKYWLITKSDDVKNISF